MIPASFLLKNKQYIFFFHLDITDGTSSKKQTCSKIIGATKTCLTFQDIFTQAEKIRPVQMARLGYRPLLSAITIVDYGHHCHAMAT